MWPMWKFLIALAGSGLAFALIDAVWLTQIGPWLYRPTLDPVLADTFRLGPAIAFYFAYLTGLVLLVVLPATESGTLGVAAGRGALLGAMAYATYDLTSYATLKVWSLKITLIDIAWGTFLTCIAACAGYAAVRAVFRSQTGAAA